MGIWRNAKRKLIDAIESLSDVNEDGAPPHYEEYAEEIAPSTLEADGWVEGRDKLDMDIDRMTNEGLGGGNVTLNNGLIKDTTTDSMEDE